MVIDGDPPSQHACRDPEHRPPTMRVYEPGIHKHTCPACGHVTVFKVGQFWL